MRLEERKPDKHLVGQPLLWSIWRALTRTINPSRVALRFLHDSPKTAMLTPHRTL